MLLMDSIIQLASIKNLVLSNHYAPDLNALELCKSLRDKLLTTPRPPCFIFDNKSIETVTELTLGRPKVFRESMTQLSIPYPKMWIEWDESGRQILRDRFPGALGMRKGLPIPSRIGFYLEAEPGIDKSKGLRTGQVTWAWQHKFSDIVNISPITIYFDLDTDYPPNVRLPDDRFILTLSELWKGNPIQREALNSIWRTCMHVPNSYGLKVTKLLKQHETIFSEFLNNSLADVVGEYIMVWATILLLAKNRERLIIREVDQSKLNKSRLKQRKIPLMAYSSITINLNKTRLDGKLKSPLGYTRKSPRIHLVSSYLKPNGKIVLPYTRGEGGNVSRRVNITT